MPVLPHTETKTVMSVVQGKSGRRTWNRAVFAVMILATTSLGAQCGSGPECASCDTKTEVEALAYVEPPLCWILMLNGVEVARRDVNPGLNGVPPWQIDGFLWDVAAQVVDVEVRGCSGATLHVEQVEPDLVWEQAECDPSRSCEQRRATIEIHEFLPPPGDDDSSDDDSAEE